MLDRRKIVALWKNRVPGTLVTLVRAEGSSYRRPGARLLAISGSSAHAGTISGGCLEAEVVRRAAWVARSGAVVERYATTFDDTAEIPYGLGCGGTVDLLFESLATPECEALMQSLTESLDGVGRKVITFLPGNGRSLRRAILGTSGEVVFASPEIGREKLECARRLAAGEVYEGRFGEYLEAPQRLFIFGAGDDAKPLAEMAGLLGWSVAVIDNRAQLAKAERFPRVQHVLAISPERVPNLEIGHADAVVLMTHSYELDRELLLRLQPLQPRYLGLLGSRHRSSLLVSEAAASLGATVEECCERLFAPVGLDIGGDGPEAIALAIIAEVQSVRHGRIGSQRRLTADEVARQIEDGGASLYLQAQCALNAG